MQDTPKYLIHADIRTSGVVERSDVVGAIFGQTEGLLGDELDLRDLSESSKVGYIDVNIESEGGRSFGTVTVASGLDRVETAVLAAALETIERVGPCRAECRVAEIEDAREAKRRELVDRASELLADFEEATMTSDELVAAVRERVRVERVTDYEGLPAGPRVADSDAIIVVEGRADVRRLLEVGIKNAVAVEGTDIPEAISDLTTGRTVTAFLDGDRGGDLILRELDQVGEIDYVAFAPTGRSVEDLDRDEIMTALRRKLPFDQVTEGRSARETFDGPEPDGVAELGSTASGDGTDDSSTEAAQQASEAVDTETEVDADNRSPERPDGAGTADDETALTDQVADAAESDDPSADAEDRQTAGQPEPSIEDEGQRTQPETLAGHVEAVVNGGLDVVRLLDEEYAAVEEGPADNAFDVLAAADRTPRSVVLDGTLDQRVLDIAAQRGVEQIVATDTGQFVKQPITVRVRRASDLEIEA